jgi:hypothetical protein
VQGTTHASLRMSDALAISYYRLEFLVRFVSRQNEQDKKLVSRT